MCGRCGTFVHRLFFYVAGVGLYDMVETSQILIGGCFLCWCRFGTRFSSKVSRLSVNLMCVCMSGFPWDVLFCVLKWSKMAVFWSDAWECVLKWSFYQHPESGSSDYRTSSPVQSVIARNLLYQNAKRMSTWLVSWRARSCNSLSPNCTNQCWCPTLDMAELQLREALQVGPENIMRFRVTSMAPPLHHVDYGLICTTSYVNLVANLPWVRDDQQPWERWRW